MNFILSWDFFSVCLMNWEVDTDCAMRLGKLMNWRQCDRVFIGGLGRSTLQLWSSLCLAASFALTQARTVHTRAQSTYFPSFFSVLFLLLSFSGFVVFHSRKKKARRSEDAGLVLVPLASIVHTNRFAVSLILIGKIVFLFFFSTTLYVHWIIEEEIKHSARLGVLLVRAVISSRRCQFDSFIHERKIHARSRQRRATAASWFLWARPIVLRADFYMQIFLRISFLIVVELLTIHFWFSRRLLVVHWYCVKYSISVERWKRCVR